MDLPPGPGSAVLEQFFSEIDCSAMDLPRAVVVAGLDQAVGLEHVDHIVELLIRPML